LDTYNKHEKVLTEYLGAERVRHRATGKEVGTSIITCLEKNGIGMNYLEEVMGDGGRNFRGEINGAIVELHMHPKAVVITMAWCPIHRYVCTSYLICTLLHIFFFFFPSFFVLHHNI
jgi:hypothetical protein